MHITPTLSATLNFLRFFAALVVVIGHMNMLGYGDWGAGIGKYGHTMVILFFVISGYIIGRTTIDLKPSPKSYFINRASRIYIVALPCLAFCFFANEIIPNSTGAETTGTYSTLWLIIKSTLFLNHSWTNFQNPPLNPPFWSLCYEVWYYIIFAAFYYPKKNSVKFALGISACFISGPAILALMPAWLCGFALVYVSPEHIKKPKLIVVFTIFLILFIVESGLDTSIKENISKVIPEIWRLGYSTKFSTDYILAILFSTLILAAGRLTINIDAKTTNLLSKLSGFSFTLYLFHDPILRLIKLQNNITNTFNFNFFVVLTVTIISCWIISKFTEARTSSLRKIMTRLTT